jgi:DNA (cytosine-5)-methyltransferase 1
MRPDGFGTHETNQNSAPVNQPPRPEDFLNRIYAESLALIGSTSEITTNVDGATLNDLKVIIASSESSKGVMTVLLTSLCYKCLNPCQDIRNHQTSIPNGYSGRTFDSNYITPFLKSHKFPSMAESGWLTRSLEQKSPYNFDYSGAIRPPSLKSAFLSILDAIENGADPESFLKVLIQGLILQRNAQIIDLAKPTALPISTILSILDQHFHGTYVADGASRLPVLAVYAAYQCLTRELKRFEGKELLPIANHTSSDIRSGRIGDVEVSDKNGRPFEAVEVKHGIPITLALVQDARSKFQTTPVDRFYLLSTADTSLEEMSRITAEAQKIKNTHGCQVIANGLMFTIKYYLRMLDNTYEFIECYVNLLENDKSIKFEHKQRWNELIEGLG